MSRTASIFRDQAEKPFVNNERNPPQHTNSTKIISQMLKKRPSPHKKTIADVADTSQSPQNYQNPPAPYRQKPNQHEEDHYETIPKSNLDDPRRKYKTNTAAVRPSQNRDNSPDLEFAPNLRKAASMPDIHHNSNLRGGEDDHDQDQVAGVTDIDDLVVRSCSVDNLLSPAPDIPPVVKQALADELKNVFGANGRKERVEKASEYHKDRPPLKNSMRGLRYYDPSYTEYSDRPDGGETSSSSSRRGSDRAIGWREKRPMKWTCEDVCDWMAHEGYNRPVTSLFRRAQVDGRDLSTITAAEITRLGVTNPTKADEINKSVDQLFASNHPQPNSKPRSKNSRKISKNRLYSSKNDEPGRAVKTSFKSSRANLKSLKSNASKSKIPSFSRPGIGLQRRASNLMAEKTGMNKTSNRVERNEYEKEDPILTQSASTVAQKAQWFNDATHNNMQTQPLKTATRQHNSPQLTSGVSRVQSLRHDLEVQERHRKLEDIFNRKRKEESMRKAGNSKDIVDGGKSSTPDDNLSCAVKLREITVRCEALLENPDSGGGKPEFDWISYEIPEIAAPRDLLREHLKCIGLNDTEEPLVVLETRECVDEKKRHSCSFRRMLHSAESIFNTHMSWSLRQRHFFEIMRESHLAEALSDGKGLDSCGRCPGLERVSQMMYKEANDALDVYAELLVVLQRIKQASHVAQHSNPFELESVLKEQLHNVISNSEALKDKRSQLSSKLFSASQKKRSQNAKVSSIVKSEDHHDELERLLEIGPSLLNMTLNTAIKLYENEEKFLMSEMREISKKQEVTSSAPSLSEITSSLYSSLSVSGHATVVSAELTPNKPNVKLDDSDPEKNFYNFKLASLRNGGVIIVSQETDSVLQEGDRLIEINGQVVVMSNSDHVNGILQRTPSARVVVMRTETRDKVISSTMEAADLREDMRLVVSELQRESNRSKKLANQKAEIAETVKSLTNEKVQLEEKIANMDDEIQEVYEKLEDANNLLNDLTEAHRDTCDHLADVTKEKVDLIEELERKDRELDRVSEHTKKTEDALVAMETEYEMLIQTHPNGGNNGGGGRGDKGKRMDPATYEQLFTVEKESLVQALQLNIEESTNQRAQLDTLLTLVEQHAPHILKMTDIPSQHEERRMSKEEKIEAIARGRISRMSGGQSPVVNSSEYPEVKFNSSNGPYNDHNRQNGPYNQQNGGSTAQNSQNVPYIEEKVQNGPYNAQSNVGDPFIKSPNGSNINGNYGPYKRLSTSTEPYKANGSLMAPIDDEKSRRMSNSSQQNRADRVDGAGSRLTMNNQQGSRNSRNAFVPVDNDYDNASESDQEI